MADEIVPRCDNPTCKEQKKTANGWYMGRIGTLSEGAMNMRIYHYNPLYSEGMLTWCSIPCIQTELGKALDISPALEEGK